jgi:hypothetical protein
MFGLLRRSHRRPRSTRRPAVSRPRLGLMRLETRDCPAAPVLTVMNVRPLTVTDVEISGKLQDEHPAGTVVNITGAAYGQATVSAQGTFDIRLTRSSTGPITARALDEEQLYSAPLSVASTGGTATSPTTISTVQLVSDTFQVTSKLTDASAPLSATGGGGTGDLAGPGGTISNTGVMPYIWFTFTNGPNRTVDVQGYVYADNPGGLPVVFSGVVTGTLYTLADGTFAGRLPASALGSFHCSTVDHHGHGTSSFTLDVLNTKPKFLSFGVDNQGGTLVLNGMVDDDYSPGLTVRFTSSIPQVNGQTATVDSNYQFDYCFTLPAGSNGGTIIATVTDWWGVTSDPAYVTV